MTAAGKGEASGVTSNVLAEGRLHRNWRQEEGAASTSTTTRLPAVTGVKGGDQPTTNFDVITDKLPPVSPPSQTQVFSGVAGASHHLLPLRLSFCLCFIPQESKFEHNKTKIKIPPN